MKASLILLMLRLTNLTNPTADRLAYFNELAEEDQVMGETFGIDPRLLVVLQFRESNLQKMAVSHDKKDVGAMQIRRTGAAEGSAYTRRELFEPRINTYLGTKYLRQQIDRCKGLTRGLAAYNRGHCTSQLAYGRATMALFRKIVREGTAIAYQR